MGTDTKQHRSILVTDIQVVLSDGCVSILLRRSLAQRNDDHRGRRRPRRDDDSRREEGERKPKRDQHRSTSVADVRKVGGAVLTSVPTQLTAVTDVF